MHSCKIYACVSGCFCMNVEARRQPLLLFRKAFETGVFNTWSLPTRLGRLSCNPQGPVCFSLLQHWDCKWASPCLIVLHGCWGLNLDLRVCKVPQLSRNSFQKDTSTWVWSHIPVILMRLGWEHHKFKAGLGNIVRPTFRKMRVLSIKMEGQTSPVSFCLRWLHFLFIVNFFSFNVFWLFSLSQFLSILPHITSTQL